jgi:hypothetical protein
LAGATIRFANTAPTPTDGVLAIMPIDPIVAIPSGRFWWPNFWYRQRQVLFACDVANPAQPAYRSTVHGEDQSISSSKAQAADGLVYFSDQFQESEITGTNQVVGPQWDLVTTTNAFLVTNVVAIPRDVWKTNTVDFKQSFNGVASQWSLAPQRANSIAAGAFHSLLSDEAGNLWSWGNLAGRSNPSADLQNPSQPQRIEGVGAVTPRGPAVPPSAPASMPPAKGGAGAPNQPPRLPRCPAKSKAPTTPPNRRSASLTPLPPPRCRAATLISSP